MNTIDFTDEVRHLQKRLAMSRTANVVLVSLLTIAAGLWLQAGIAKTADRAQPHAAAQISIYGLHRQVDTKAMPELPFHDQSFVFTSP